jgi:phosphohistidine phosphatase
VIPKGIVETDLSPAASAAKEALEEAGVEGRIDAEPLGTYTYRKWGGTCTVEVYAMAVDTIHELWLESERQREWLAPGEAATHIDEPELKELIQNLRQG